MHGRQPRHAGQVVVGGEGRVCGGRAERGAARNYLTATKLALPPPPSPACPAPLSTAPPLTPAPQHHHHHHILHLLLLCSFILLHVPQPHHSFHEPTNSHQLSVPIHAYHTRVPPAHPLPTRPRSAPHSLPLHPQSPPGSTRRSDKGNGGTRAGGPRRLALSNFKASNGGLLVKARDGEEEEEEEEQTSNINNNKDKG
ncbi:hypothetical protein E2C01_092351 [Portunus trituberculatus]|uniref:Uncharacterized protein n=1 Tax=Portunus trituberculatus TaxID=210409 RepID=A0A5B7JG88_PORTR|nr:hypothetical protein [Portunus trituberculatus]